jgi:hypothetical protein
LSENPVLEIWAETTFRYDIHTAPKAVFEVMLEADEIEEIAPRRESDQQIQVTARASPAFRVRSEDAYRRSAV